ncbi:hypothetical protein [Clostridium hydrogenum]|uniref:hypothetical protein n=1 Tax=Clostridium hydrogenum TaxID=2855764 RepID=UPI001F33C2E3|nr:hypothetical protein [Clostridium hydrogenum]
MELVKFALIIYIIGFVAGIFMFIILIIDRIYINYIHKFKIIDICLIIYFVADVIVINILIFSIIKLKLVYTFIKVMM